MSLFTLQSRCTNSTKHPLHRPSVDQPVKSTQPPIHRLLPRIPFPTQIQPSPVEMEHVSTSPDIATNPDSTSHRSTSFTQLCSTTPFTVRSRRHPFYGACAAMPKQQELMPWLEGKRRTTAMQSGQPRWSHRRLPLRHNHPVGFLLRLGQRRQEQRWENCDDRDDDEQAQISVPRPLRQVRHYRVVTKPMQPRRRVATAVMRNRMLATRLALEPVQEKTGGEE